MLTKIGDALGGWKPRAGAGGDPLVAIRAAWMGLVGVEVARAAQPVAIQNDTLVVVTASSAWSHQLTFLESDIMRGVRALPEARAVLRLRFRVGTIRRSTAGMPAAAKGARRRPAPGAQRPAPATPEAALAGFRAAVERTRAAHAAAGGEFCARCGATTDRGNRCTPCADYERAELTAATERLLYEAPWLQPEDVLASLPGLEPGAYDAIRRRLLRSWWDEMALARKRASLPRPVPLDRMRLRKLASSYVLLETKIDPNRLQMDSAVRKNALGDLYEFIRAVERGE